MLSYQFSMMISIKPPDRVYIMKRHGSEIPPNIHTAHMRTISEIKYFSWKSSILNIIDSNKFSYLTGHRIKKILNGRIEFYELAC